MPPQPSPRFAVVTRKLSRLAHIKLPAVDQDKMLKFYTDTLGLEKRADAPFGPGLRWIEVALPDAPTTIAITPPGPGSTPGGQDTGITFETDDARALHAQLKELGVKIDAEVTDFGPDIPPMFWLHDPEDNVLAVVQAR
ncbi:VOC family protein [Candidatus Saccharibacteria bacterium]|nr:VOC family protein [Candidatus Saccharibacteria bacterium]